MKYYTEIPIWENARRIRQLLECRRLLAAYSDSLDSGEAGGLGLGGSAAGLRSRLEQRIDELQAIVVSSGLDPVSPIPLPIEPAGRIRRVNLIAELFAVARLSSGRRQVVALLDRSLKVYLSNRSRAWLQAFNPLHYIGALFAFLAAFPFRLLERFGLGRAKVGNAGRVVIAIIEIAALALLLFHLVKSWRRYWSLIGMF